MADAAKLKLTFRLVPADGQPADPVVLDDIVRLIRQAAATAPKDAARVTEPADGFDEPSDNDKRALQVLQSKIETRIDQSSAASQAAVAKRVQTASQPDGHQALADEALAAAEQVVAAAQRAIFQRVAVHVPA